MNFGNLLGSISPAFGLASGQGFGQYLPYLSPAFALAQGGDKQKRPSTLPPDPAASFPQNYWANAPHTPDSTGHSMLDHPGQFENGWLSGQAFNIQDNGVSPPRGTPIYNEGGPMALNIDPSLMQTGTVTPGLGQRLGMGLAQGLQNMPQQGGGEAPMMPVAQGGRGRSIVASLLDTIGRRNYLGQLSAR